MGAMMLKKWAFIEKASSHSGRTTLLTHIIHTQKLPISVAQKVAGHINPSTTVIYTQPTEQEISEALRNVGYPPDVFSVVNYVMVMKTN
jgi:site-specific recombinase XerD